MMNDRGVIWRVALTLVAGLWALPVMPNDAVSDGEPTAAADGRPDWRKPGGVPNRAPVLGTIGSQSLSVGKRWRLHLRGRDPDGEAPLLTISPLPERAAISVRPDGWYVLAWTPRHEDAGRLDLQVTATDAQDESLRTERTVTLLIAPAQEPAGDLDAAEPTLVAPESTPESTPEAPAELTPELPPEPGLEPTPEPVTTLAPEKVPSDELNPPEEPLALFEDEEDIELPPEPEEAVPTIAPPAAQIVSTGRTVSYRVVATLEDGRVPLMEIDRLPLNASFDPNPDGSHTFFWPTGNADQGEHRFRVTARDPWNRTSGTSADLLIVVGDPTRSKTEPGDVIAPPDPAARERDGGRAAEAADLPAGLAGEDVDFLDTVELPPDDLESLSEQDDDMAFEEEYGPSETTYFDDPLENDPFYPTDDEGYEGQMSEFDENYENEYGDSFDDEFPDDGPPQDGYFESGYEDTPPPEILDENYGADPEYILE